MGGDDADGNNLPNVDIFDPVSGMWRKGGGYLIAFVTLICVICNASAHANLTKCMQLRFYS
jgi:hypothetical protein